MEGIHEDIEKHCSIEQGLVVILQLITFCSFESSSVMAAAFTNCRIKLIFIYFLNES